MPSAAVGAKLAAAPNLWVQRTAPLVGSIEWSAPKPVVAKSLPFQYASPPLDASPSLSKNGTKLSDHNASPSRVCAITVHFESMVKILSPATTGVAVMTDRLLLPSPIGTDQIGRISEDSCA